MAERPVRAHGRYSDRVLLLGSLDSIAPLAGEFGRASAAGYRVVGAVAPGATAGELPGTVIALSSDIDRVTGRMAELRANTPVVTSSDEFTPQRTRELSWELDPGRQQLVVAPGLAVNGRRRIQMRLVADLPLAHVVAPRYGGTKALVKRTSGLASSVLLFVLLFVTAAVVRLRTHDPRVNSLGRSLRRFSLDEPPQLLNVFAGQTSLVGPRPPLEQEVDRYVRRKSLVKPGITVLWQISGRSRLSWEDSIWLDLYYVENRSLIGDVVVLWCTLKEALRGDGEC